jgi:molybdopterin biosynthesis enzyme
MPGLLKVDVTRLNQVNNQEGFVLATLHNNRVVKKDQVIAGTRIVPLSIGKNELQRVEEICAHSTPLLSIKPFIKQKAGIVTTGNEIFQRRVQDRFYPTLEQKLRPFGASILSQTFCPDDPKLIAEQILTMQDKGAELILVTGGMSVDCNDLTPKGIELSGASIIKYGPPILPASQFILAYLGDIPICGIPGGALFSRITTFDLLLPRLLAGDQIERSEIVAMGHGGLCMDCPECFFPDCAFGKSNS